MGIFFRNDELMFSQIDLDNYVFGRAKTNGKGLTTKGPKCVNSFVLFGFTHRDFIRTPVPLFGSHTLRTGYEVFSLGSSPHGCRDVTFRAAHIDKC